MRTGIFIGRFQPVHLGHTAVFSYLHDNFDRIIVLIGSANRRLSIKNPFTVDTRKGWIEQAFREIAASRGATFDASRLTVDSINDYLYNDTKWETDVFFAVDDVIGDDEEEGEVTLVGHEKDDTSYYLRSFPHWKFEPIAKQFDADATDIRAAWFESGMTSLGSLADRVPAYVAQDMTTGWLNNEALMEEHRFYQKEAQIFASYPYPDTLKFTCADAVLLCKGHILLVQRKFAPGKGCWALPGGFVQQNETFEQAALRELFEETRVKVPARVVAGSLKASRVFDDPRRCLGIPRISQAFMYEVQPDASGRLPKVRGSDDAADAQWIPLAKARQMPLYDDHGDIIDYFTGSL